MLVSKWGNSLAVRIPAMVAEALNLTEGDEIEVTIAGSRRFEIARSNKRDKALERLRALKTPLPEGFRFERDDANAR
jgi:antitoxin MazE